MTQAKRGWIVAACVVAAIVSLFAWLGTTAEHLILGWLYFPLRVVPQMTVDPPAALIGLTALILLISVIHVTARWLVRETAAAEGAPRSWSPASTMAATLLLLLMFAAGIAMVGATHQLVWLATGRVTAAQERSAPVEGLIGQLRAYGRKMEAGNNLKWLGIGMQTYHDTWKTFPAGGTVTESGELLHGWAIFIGPQTGYYAEDIDYSVPWNEPPNDRYYKGNLTQFVNPALTGPYFDQEGFALSHYAGNVHVLPLREFTGQQHWIPPRVKLEGQSNAILIGTVVENFKPWGHPANLRDPARGINTHPDGFGGPANWGGAQFVMCDGAVRFFSSKTDPKVLAQLASPGADSDSGRP
jgi:hypothetical protein